MDKSHRPAKSMIPIGEVLAEVLETFRSKGNGGIMHLIRVWEKTIGPPIADNAKPFALNGALLLVHVSSSVWLHQLRFLKTELLETLNRELKPGAISDIKFKVGPL